MNKEDLWPTRTGWCVRLLDGEGPVPKAIRWSSTVHCGPRLSRPVIVSAPRWHNLHPHIASVKTPSKSILTIFMPRMSRRKEREGGDDFNHRSCYYLPSFLSILYFSQAECKLLITFGSSEGPERNHLASRATIRAFANSLRWNADYCNLHQYCTAPHRCTLTPTSGSGTTLT